MDISKKYQSKSEFCNRRLQNVIKDIYQPRYNFSIRDGKEQQIKSMFYKYTSSMDTKDMERPAVKEMIERLQNICDWMKTILNPVFDNTLLWLHLNYDRNQNIYGDIEIKGKDKDGLFNNDYFIDMANLIILRPNNTIREFWTDPQYKVKGCFVAGKIEHYSEETLESYKGEPIFEYLINIRDYLRLHYSTKTSLLTGYEQYLKGNPEKDIQAKKDLENGIQMTFEDYLSLK